MLVGWVPSEDLAGLTAALAAVGAAAVELPRPLLVEPPTLLRTRGLARRFAPLVRTYGAPRYADLDPTPFAALSFVFMFGMMFGDAGHGLLLAALGLALRWATGPRAGARWRRLAPLRPLWPFAVAGGLVATVFGLLYGEAFGPTGIAPALWIKPLDHPVRAARCGARRRRAAARRQLRARDRQSLEGVRLGCGAARAVGHRGLRGVRGRGAAGARDLRPMRLRC